MFINPQLIASKNAKLCVLEGAALPFDVKRVYYINDTPVGETRGFHAHKTLEQILISLWGRTDIEMDDGHGDKKIYVLDSPEKVLYVGPMFWHTMTWKTSATLMVLASQGYNADDYIRDYGEFLALSGQATRK